jgi:hypothetical protein
VVVGEEYAFTPVIFAIKIARFICKGSLTIIKVAKLFFVAITFAYLKFSSVILDFVSIKISPASTPL